MSEQTLLKSTTGVTAGLDILGGLFGLDAAMLQADSLRNQAALVKSESEADIVRYAENAKDFKTRQAMAYGKSGVTLEGSPLDVLDETARIAGENINAMRAKTNADVLGIRSKASALVGKGREALVSGFSGAARVYSSQAEKLKKMPGTDTGI